MNINYSERILPKHIVSLGLGITHAQGTDGYKVSARQLPGFDFVGEMRGETGKYWGGLFKASYAYLFYKDKLSIGTDLLYRTYSGNYPSFLNYRMSLGFHF